MAKLHHKLKELTDYLNADLRSANSKTDNSDQAIDLATATLGVALRDTGKAVKMRPIVAASENTYQDTAHPYNLKVAIFVSKHRVMDGDDYTTVRNAIDNLNSDQVAAKKDLPLPKRHKFLGIF